MTLIAGIASCGYSGEESDLRNDEETKSYRVITYACQCSMGCPLTGIMSARIPEAWPTLYYPVDGGFTSLIGKLRWQYRFPVNYESNHTGGSTGFYTEFHEFKNQLLGPSGRLTNTYTLTGSGGTQVVSNWTGLSFPAWVPPQFEVLQDEASPGSLHVTCTHTGIVGLITSPYYYDNTSTRIDLKPLTTGRIYSFEGMMSVQATPFAPRNDQYGLARVSSLDLTVPEDLSDPTLYFDFYSWCWDANYRMYVCPEPLATTSYALEFGGGSTGGDTGDDLHAMDTMFMTRRRRLEREGA